jgi:spore coat polysaccharide biosynthesis protein SpsF
MTVLDHALRNLSEVEADVHAVLTDQASAPALMAVAQRWGFDLFQGPRDDVLERFSLAISHFGVDMVVRATGDNPLVSVSMARLAMEQARTGGADYFGFQGAPLGTGVEVVRSSALLSARQESVDPYEREHVCPFLYRRPERFSIHRPQVPEPWRGDERLTLDTREDYLFFQEIFRSLYQGEPLGLAEVLQKIREAGFARP